MYPSQANSDEQGINKPTGFGVQGRIPMPSHPLLMLPLLLLSLLLLREPILVFLINCVQFSLIINTTLHITTVV